MSKGCFYCLRILVILFNLIFVLIGCAILGIAIFLYVDKTFKGIKDNMEDQKLMIDILLFSAIGVGGITIIVSTFGCCGAYHESECLLGTYFFCLFIIVAAEIAAGVVGYLKFNEDTVKEVLTKSIKSSIDAYMKDSTDTEPPEHLKQMQRRLECCGANSYLDYASFTDLTINSNKLMKLAKACAPDSGDFKITQLGILKPGCTNTIYEKLSDKKIWVLVVCLVVAAFEIISMIVAMSLCCTVRRMESGYIGVST